MGSAGQPAGPSGPASGAAASERPAARERVVLDDTRIRRALVRIAHEVVESNADLRSLYLVSIPNGGVPLGRILVKNIAEISDVQVPLGILDTTLYRDDLALRGTRPRLRRTEMPSSVDGRVVVLVEDVVNTGRTIRAGMDALMDFGRPRAVQVVALVDRGHRELPIKIDYVGKNIPTRPGETVVFRGEEEDGASPLEAVVQEHSHEGGSEASEGMESGGRG
ncbi:MAG: bifunctional pyr operon transcriptional regulator/uracil phosphoribosyltransferase PyrR [Deltaproteobacteria bacterium]|nr:bifunctional pyr operon transcriptional regulator/uracil phosphoribosyltransferase PyrR [Deltaproteobacteria bacterium]MBW2696398.1 bifunctional pyr operon transcriptional regulator/uracil phosphoribosyltransferase PyrR [Deltaproteobacteria bacterium]